MKKVEKEIHHPNPDNASHQRRKHVLARKLRRYTSAIIKLKPKIIAAVKFLLFMEDYPKHRVAENLHPIHAVLTFFYCLLAPSLVFFATFTRFGLIGTILAETLLLVFTLEAFHIAFDR